MNLEKKRLVGDKMKDIFLSSLLVKSFLQGHASTIASSSSWDQSPMTFNSHQPLVLVPHGWQVLIQGMFGCGALMTSPAVATSLSSDSLRNESHTILLIRFQLQMDSRSPHPPPAVCRNNSQPTMNTQHMGCHFSVMSCHNI